MTYIWNRVDRVPVEYMPKALEKPFKRWVKKNNKILNKTTDKKKQKQIINKINKHTTSYTDALSKYKNKNNT